MAATTDVCVPDIDMPSNNNGSQSSTGIRLKDWFCGGGSREQPQEEDGSLLFQLWPRILLLDGGVSTHLEEMLQQQQQQQVHADDAGDDAVVVTTAAADVDVFPYRELWSSGLLLNEGGRELILQGHLDWLQAGANVISTVTYQCHYERSLWPHPQLIISNNDDGDGDDDDPGQTTTTIRLTDAMMDQMWKDGIALARRATTMMEPTTTLYHHHRQGAVVPTFVVASLGCYGAALANGAEYTGNYNFDKLDDDDDDDDDDENNNNATAAVRDRLREFHRRKLHTAVTLQPDGIAMETIPSLIECQAIRDLLLGSDEGLRLECSNVACYVSLACHNGSELNDGTPLIKALDVFRNVPVNRLQAIGLNCCNPQHLNDLLNILVYDMATMQSQQQRQRRGIVVYPNSGERWDAEHQQWCTKGTGVGTVTDDEDDDMANQLMQIIYHIEDTWRKHNNSSSDTTTTTTTASFPSILIGGCCRTQPATIKALRTLVDAHLATPE